MHPIPIYYLSLTSFTGVSGRERRVLPPVSCESQMMSSSPAFVDHYAETPLDERVDRSTVIFRMGRRSPSRSCAIITAVGPSVHPTLGHPSYIAENERLRGSPTAMSTARGRSSAAAEKAARWAVGHWPSRIPNQASTPRTGAAFLRPCSKPPRRGHGVQRSIKIGVSLGTPCLIGFLVLHLTDSPVVLATWVSLAVVAAVVLFS
jgi:hypothetical protein